MSEDIPKTSESWWNRQSGGSKAVIGIVGFCCLGIIILVISAGLFAPDASTNNNSVSSDNSSDSVETDQNTTPVSAETETEYKASCKKISFKQLDKNPDAHTGERVKLSGQIVQIMENSGYSEIRMDVNDNFGDTVYITYLGTTPAVEDDMITIYGEVTGSYTYESQAGWTVTLPEISAKYITVSS